VPNGGQFYKRWFASTGVLLIKAPLLSLFVPQRIRVCTEHPGQNDLLVLKELMESGKLTPVVGSTYPLSRTREAMSYFGEGHAEGKVVITVRERMSDPSAVQQGYRADGQRGQRPGPDQGQG
jgi:NADPH:quinone reductase-like Zn-dependent oxidoreductase